MSLDVRNTYHYNNLLVVYVRPCVHPSDETEGQRKRFDLEAHNTGSLATER